MSMHDAAVVVRLNVGFHYRDWPTIPQLYVDGEFVGGCDILLSSKHSLDEYVESS